MTTHDTPVMIDLDDGDAIAAYGREWIGDALIAEATALLTSSPSRRLIETMGEISQALQADPHGIRRSTGFLGRLIGADIEQEARARQLQDRLGWLVSFAEQQATELKGFIAALDDVRQRFQAAALGLAGLIDQGRRHLAALPGPATTGHANGDDFREHAPPRRFERRLAHLATVAASHEMTSQQLRLARAQATAVLDSYGKIRDVLLPVWRQRALALSNQELLDTTLADNSAHAVDVIQTEIAAARSRSR